MAQSLPHISIPQAEDLESLRLTIERAVNITIDRINAQKLSEDLDMQQLRITNLARPASLRDAVNVEYLQKSLADLAKRLRDATHVIVESVVTGGGAITTYATTVLTAPTTNLTHAPPADNGTLLVYLVTQDATGGRQITWDIGSFDGSPPVQIDGTPNATSLFLFTGVNGRWVLLSYQSGLSI